MSNPYQRTTDAAEELVILRDQERAAREESGSEPYCSRPLLGDAFSAYTGLVHARDLCHGLASRSGWWTDLESGDAIDPDDPLVFGQKIALIHSEVSEAMEGHRKGLMDDHLPHRKMVEAELADVLIRVLDTAGAMKLDLAGGVIEKLFYNTKRADHKLENRRAENGKRY